MALGAEERAALRVLVEELGLVRALAVGVSVQVAALRGEPFADLPPATDFPERGSRQQAGPAVLLYRALARRVGEAEGLRITGRAVEVGAMTFLGRTLGRLERRRIEAMDEAERDRFAKEKAAGFPNAELVWEEISPTRVVFAVTRCRLVELVRHAGHPELAPLFCVGDARYFREVEAEAELLRPTTLAAGDDRCRFTIRFEENG